MKMTLIRLIAIYLFILLIIASEKTYSQQSAAITPNTEGTIALNSVIDDSLFRSRYIVLNKCTYDDFPETLKGSVNLLNTKYSLTSSQFYYTYFTSTGQVVYLQFLKKRMDTATFIRFMHMYDIDTEKLSKTSVNDKIYFYTGKKGNGDVLVVMDENNNKSFSDDSIFCLKNGDPGFYNNPYDRKLSHVELSNGAVTYNIGLDISLKFSRFTKSPQPVDDSIGIMYKINGYREGFIDIGATRIKFAIRPNPVSRIAYDGLSNIKVIGSAPSPNNIYNRIGDTVYIEGYEIVLKRLSILGDSLEYIIVRSFKGSKPLDSNPSKHPYDFSLKELNGNSFKHYNVFDMGKYVL